MKKGARFLFVMTVMLVSCQQISDPDNATPESYTVSPPTSSIPIAITHPTVVPPTPTMELTATIMPTFTVGPTTLAANTIVQEPSSNGFIRHCIEISPSPPQEFQSFGLVAMQAEDGYFLLDMATGNKISLSEEYRNDLSPSPSESWFADTQLIYDTSGMNIVSRQLDILAPDGTIQASILLEDEQFFGGWLDDQRIEIMQNVIEDNLYSTIVYNPFTGERQELPYDYPDRYSFFADPIAFKPIVYNPGLTHVVYPYSNNDGIGFTLRDIVNGRNLVQIFKFLSGALDGPQWSPDGKEFAIIGKPGSAYDEGNINLLSINIEGEITPLTNFNENYSASFGEDFSWDRSNWSPDGRYIAIWIWKDTRSNGAELGIVDVKTKQVLNYCIRTNSQWLAMPLWSPNSSEFVVMYLDENGTKETILIDVEQSKAIEIMKGAEPLYWLRVMPINWFQSNP